MRDGDWGQDRMKPLPPPPMPPAWQVLAARTDLRTPDQDRYGPKTIQGNGPTERDGLLTYVPEGDGWTISCPCGQLLRWAPTKTQVQAWGADHTRSRMKDGQPTYDCAELRRLEKIR